MSPVNSSPVRHETVKSVLSSVITGEQPLTFADLHPDTYFIVDSTSMTVPANQYICAYGLLCKRSSTTAMTDTGQVKEIEPGMQVVRIYAGTFRPATNR